MITETPAKIAKINAGKLENGYRADIVVFDEDINIKSVFVNGLNVFNFAK